MRCCSSGVASGTLLLSILLSFVESWSHGRRRVLSSFSTPIRPASSRSGVRLGHLSWSLVLLRDKIGGGAGGALCEVLYRVIPNLERFNVKAEVVHGVNVPAIQVLWATGYGLGWTVLILLAAAIVFTRRDFQ